MRVQVLQVKLVQLSTQSGKNQVCDTIRRVYDTLVTNIRDSKIYQSKLLYLQVRPYIPNRLHLPVSAHWTLTPLHIPRFHHDRFAGEFVHVRCAQAGACAGACVPRQCFSGPHLRLCEFLDRLVTVAYISHLSVTDLALGHIYLSAFTRYTMIE